MPDNETEATESPRKPESIKDIYRAASVPIAVTRAEDTEDGPKERTLEGYFSVFNTPYRISSFWEGDFYEVVERGAFARAIQERGNSIRVLLEHGFDPTVGNKPLGKMKEIAEDSHGGRYAAGLYDSTYVRELIPALEAGDYEASFRFRVREDSWDYEPGVTSWNPEGLPVRTLKDVDVLEVGPSLWGANPEATSGVRSMTDRYNKDLAHAETRTESKHDNTTDDNQVEETPQGVSAEEVTESVEVRTEEDTEQDVNTSEVSVNEKSQEESTEDDESSLVETEAVDESKDNSNSERSTTKMAKPNLDELRARLSEIDTRCDEIDAEFPDFNYSEEVESERSKLDEEAEELRAHEAKLLKRQEDMAARAQRASATEEVRGTVETRKEGGAKVTSEPETYRQGGRNSYFRDLYRATHKSDYAASQRLQRNDNEVRAGVTTVDGDGGEFVPPLWMVQNFVELARAGRVTADQLASEALPSGTDSINLPRVTVNPTVAEQLPANQNTAIDETDAKSDSITANVATIAGGQTIAVQNLEQSPINMDGILLRELAKDYAVKLDTFVLNNNAAGKVGLLNVSGANAVTYTAAPGTVAGLYPKVADAIQQIHTGRFDSPDRIVMHPRRWAWLTAAVDTQNRPLVVPAAQAPQNVIAMAGGVAAQGFVGSMQGLPVFVDPNLPTNLGVAPDDTQDPILVFKADDSILFEGTPRAEAFRETKADTMSVFLRFYNYTALHASRYPKSISIITGTGLEAPSF